MKRVQRSLNLNLARSLSTWALACLAAACSAERAEVPKAVNAMPSPPAPSWTEDDSRAPLPGEGSVCPVSILASRFDEVRAQHPELFQGYRIQSPEHAMDCDIAPSPGASSGFERITGYTSVYLYPRVDATGELEVTTPAPGREARIYLGYREAPVSPELRQGIVNALAITPSAVDPETAIQKMPFAPDFALLPTGQQATVSVEQHVFGRAAAPAPALVLHFAEGFPAGFDAALATFRAGGAPLRIYSSRAGLNEKRHLLSWTLYLQNQAARDSQDEVSIFGLLPELWGRASTAPAAWIAPERSRVIIEAGTWLRHSGADSSESAAALGDLIAYAHQGWEPAPDPAHLSPDAGVDLIQRLAFLSIAAPDDSAAQRYLEPMSQLDSFYGSRSADAAEWVQEIQFLAGHPYTLDQENWVFSAARRIQDGTGNTDGARSWQLAKRLQSYGGIEVPQAALVVRAMDWLSGAGASSEGPHLAAPAALDKAVGYVRQHGLTDASFQLLQDYALWSATYPGPQLAPADALARAEQYVFDRGVDRGHFELLKGAFLWVVVDGGGPQLPRERGLEFAENYLFVQRMTAERFALLKAAYAWLATPPGPALPVGPALNKAQNYVFTRSMSAAQWNALCNAYASLHLTMSHEDALARAEGAAFPAAH